MTFSGLSLDPIELGLALAGIGACMYVIVALLPSLFRILCLAEMRDVQMRVMAILAAYGPMRQEQLRRVLNADPAGFPGLLEDLEAEGKVSRSDSPSGPWWALVERAEVADDEG